MFKEDKRELHGPLNGRICLLQQVVRLLSTSEKTRAPLDDNRLGKILLRAQVSAPLLSHEDSVEAQYKHCDTKQLHSTKQWNGPT